MGVGIAVAAGIVVLALLIGGTVALYGWLNTSAKSNPRNNGGGIHPSIGVSVDPSPTVKYPLTSLPDNMCDKVAVGELAKSFEAPDGSPRADRNASAYLGSASCSFSLQHNEDGDTIAVATASFSVYLFTSPSAATTSQKDALNDAKLNKGTMTNVPGLGDEAFATLEDGDAAQPGTSIESKLQARDGNLQWNVSLIANRISGKWTPAQMNQVQANFIAAAKSSYAKYRAG
jgi:hypothetical protein